MMVMMMIIIIIIIIITASRLNLFVGVSVSNLVQDPSYPNIFVVSLIPSREMPTQYAKLGRDSFSTYIPIHNSLPFSLWTICKLKI